MVIIQVVRVWSAISIDLSRSRYDHNPTSCPQLNRHQLLSSSAANQLIYYRAGSIYDSSLIIMIVYYTDVAALAMPLKLTTTINYLSLAYTNDGVVHSRFPCQLTSTLWLAPLLSHQRLKVYHKVYKAKLLLFTNSFIDKFYSLNSCASA